MSFLCGHSEHRVGNFRLAPCRSGADTSHPSNRKIGAHCHPRLRKSGAIREPWCWGPRPSGPARKLEKALARLGPLGMTITVANAALSALQKCMAAVSSNLFLTNID